MNYPYVNKFKVQQEAKLSVINLRKFMLPIDRETSNLCQQIGTKPIKLWLDGDNTHFMERIILRKVDKTHLGALFSKLMKLRICEVLYFFEYHQELYNSRMKNSSTFYINLKYKTANVVVMCKNLDTIRKIIPKTVLSKSMKPVVDYTIEFE